MAKNKISEYSATSADNTDISNINIAEGCSPANVNNAIRSVMAQLKDFQSANPSYYTADSDALSIGAGGTGAITATTARTNLTAAKSGANSDITSLTACTSITGLTTPLTTAQGGTGTASTTFANLTTNVTGTLPVANGGTGATTLTSGSVIVGAGTSTPTFVAPTTAGNCLFTTDGTSWSSTPKITSATAQNTTSGTSIDFTSIPSWVKRITVLLNGVSTNGSSPVMVQLGDAGGFELTTYVGAISEIATGVGTSNYSTGFAIDRVSGNTTPASLRYTTLTLINISDNVWVEGHTNSYSNIAITHYGSGIKSLSDKLTQVRITTINGTDTFDAGTINIMYE